MNDPSNLDSGKSLKRVEEAYATQKPLLLARLKAAGRTLEEAEDFVHDLYTETLHRLPLVGKSAACRLG